MYTFAVPIAKLGRSIDVTLSGDTALQFHAAHGLKQRLNDTTASIKRGDYDDEALFRADVESAVAKVAAKIESDTVGVRVPKVETKAAKLAARITTQFADVTDEEMAKVLAMLGELRKAA